MFAMYILVRARVDAGGVAGQRPGGQTYLALGAGREGAVSEVLYHRAQLRRSPPRASRSPSSIDCVSILCSRRKCAERGCKSSNRPDRICALFKKRGKFNVSPASQNGACARKALTRTRSRMPCNDSHCARAALPGPRAHTGTCCVCARRTRGCTRAIRSQASAHGRTFSW